MTNNTLWQASVERFSERELDILRHVADGYSNREIAQELYLSLNTVKWYNHQIYGKLGVESRTQAIARARDQGMLDTEEPPQASGAANPRPRNTLPAQLTSFIGREREREEIRALLRTSRLVTLTGPPGTGKTRLAQEAAREMLVDFDEVYLVLLAPIQDARYALSGIAQVLEMRESDGETLLAAVQRRLRQGRFLLVLDNFEHVLDAAPLVSDLLASAPDLAILVTSREILRLYGENEYPVPPLRLPDLERVILAVAVESTEAVQLFVQRARASSPGFALNDKNAAAVAGICVHLDGLPLAIELAAARVRFDAPELLRLRLGSRLETLKDGPRGLPARQRTLRATLAWSYDLLEDAEKTLFARLGVFSGGWMLDAAEAICAKGLPFEVVDGLESLLDKNLIRQVESASGQARFAMLETIHEYAAEKLRESDEAEAIRGVYQAFWIDLAARAWTEMIERDQVEWGRRLAEDIDNIRSVLRDATARRDWQTVMRIVTGLDEWVARWGLESEMRGWLEPAVAGEEVTDRALQAFALLLMGNFWLFSDFDAAAQYHRRSLDLYRTLGDELGTARVLNAMGVASTLHGEYEQALSLHRESLGIAEALGNRQRVMLNALNIAMNANYTGDFDQARLYAKRALEMAEADNHTLFLFEAWWHLAELDFHQEDFEAATAHSDRCQKVARQIGGRWVVAIAVAQAGEIALRRADLATSERLHREALRLWADMGIYAQGVWALATVAALVARQGEGERSAVLFGAAERLRERWRFPVAPADRSAYDEDVAVARAQMDGVEFEKAWAEGRAMSFDEAVEYALQEGHG